MVVCFNIEVGIIEGLESLWNGEDFEGHLSRIRKITVDNAQG